MLSRSNAITLAIAAAVAATLTSFGSDDAQAAFGKLGRADYCRSYGDRPITGLSPSGARLALLGCTNEARKASGVPPLALDGKLIASAQSHADRLVALRWWDEQDGETSHADPELGGIATRIGASRFCPGGILDPNENTFTAAGQGWDDTLGRPLEATPKAAVGWWMADPPHRATMLGTRYTHVGFGVAEGFAIRADPEPTASSPAGTFVMDVGGCR